MSREKVLRLAREIMQNFDTVISLFDMTFVYISEESADLSGYTPKEMVGKHISNFMATGAKSDEFRTVILNSMSGKATVPIRKKSGKVIEIPMEFITINVEGEPFLVTSAIKKKR